MAHWHGMAKLRMHHDLTLDILEAVTKALGEKLRKFSDVTCVAFETKELQREYNARMRRQARQADPTNFAIPSVNPVAHASKTTALQSGSAEMGTNSPTQSIAPSVVQVPKQLGRRRKVLNLNTFKGHSLGDYVESIRRCGTTDSYSTEPVCHESPFSSDQTKFSIGRTRTSFTEVEIHSYKP